MKICCFFVASIVKSYIIDLMKQTCFTEKPLMRFGLGAKGGVLSTNCLKSADAHNTRPVRGFTGDALEQLFLGNQLLV